MRSPRRPETRTARKACRSLRRFGLFCLLVPVLLAVALAVGVLSDRITWQTESALYPRRYMALVEQASARWGVPTSVVYAVIRTESSFRETVVSPADAKGLMQLTDDTYEWLYFLRGEHADLDTIMIPSYNIDAGCALLAWLYGRYGVWETAYAAYNAGYSRVNRWLEDPKITENGRLVRIPITETANYVRIVTETEAVYRKLYGGDPPEDTPQTGNP